MAVNRRSRLVDGEMIERAGFSWRMIDNVGRLRLYEPVLVNTDESGGPGIHWLLWMKLPGPPPAGGDQRSPDTTFIYDPLGSGNRQDYMAPPPANATYFKGKSQTNDSVLCGYFCLHVAELFKKIKPKTVDECNQIIQEEFGLSPDLGDVKHLMTHSKYI